MACDSSILPASIHGCEVRNQIQQRVLVLSETAGGFLRALLYLQLDHCVCPRPDPGCDFRCRILLYRVSTYLLASWVAVSQLKPLADRSITLHPSVLLGGVRFSSGPSVALSNLPWPFCMVLALLHDHLHVSLRSLLSGKPTRTSDRYICGYYDPNKPYVIYDCGNKDFISLF